MFTHFHCTSYRKPQGTIKFVRMIWSKGALSKLSFEISIIMLCPAVVKLLASKIAFGLHGQTMVTAIGLNEAKLHFDR